MKGNLRKIVMGKDFNSCVTYMVGGRGARGTTISAIIPREYCKECELPSVIDVYITNGNSQVLWNTFTAIPLQIENNVELA